MLQAQPVLGAAQHPGARVVVADMERDPQLVCRILAATYMHHQALALEGIGRIGARFVDRDAAFERLAAMRGYGGHEGIGRCHRHLVPDGVIGAAAGGDRQRSDQRKKFDCVHAPTLTGASGQRKPRA